MRFQHQVRDGTSYRKPIGYTSWRQRTFQLPRQWGKLSLSFLNISTEMLVANSLKIKIISQESDFLVYATVPTVERQKIIDITTPWYYGTLEFLIPVLDDGANIDAVVKPFQWMVK